MWKNLHPGLTAKSETERHTRMFERSGDFLWFPRAPMSSYGFLPFLNISHGEFFVGSVQLPCGSARYRRICGQGGASTATSNMQHKHNVRRIGALGGSKYSRSAGSAPGAQSRRPRRLKCREFNRSVFGTVAIDQSTCRPVHLLLFVLFLCVLCCFSSLCVLFNRI